MADTQNVLVISTDEEEEMEGVQGAEGGQEPPTKRPKVEEVECLDPEEKTLEELKAIEEEELDEMWSDMERIGYTGAKTMRELVLGAIFDEDFPSVPGPVENAMREKFMETVCVSKSKIRAK